MHLARPHVPPPPSVAGLKGDIERGRAAGGGEPKQPCLFCPGCKSKDFSGWYHFACYWRCHRAVVT
eukprot:5858625-Prymnesium_polylepis.1